MNSLVDKDPNTFLTNGSATPAHCSPCPTENVPPPTEEPIQQIPPELEPVNVTPSCPARVQIVSNLTNVVAGVDIVTFIHNVSTCGDSLECVCDGTNWFAIVEADASGAMSMA